MLSMIQETVLQEGYLSSTRCHRCSKTAGRGSRSPGGWARTGRRRRDRGLRAEGRRGSRSGCYSSRGSRCCSRRDTRRRSQVGTGLEHNLLCNMTDNDFSLDHCGCWDTIYFFQNAFPLFIFITFWDLTFPRFLHAMRHSNKKNKGEKRLWVLIFFCLTWIEAFLDAGRKSFKAFFRAAIDGHALGCSNCEKEKRNYSQTRLRGSQINVNPISKWKHFCVEVKCFLRFC